jgi:hypothetical protein
MAYLLDNNVFIQAKNLQYGFDFCPAFWDWLVKAHREGRLHSIRQIRNELAAGDDELVTWAELQGDGFFVPTDAPALAAASVVSDWTIKQGFDPAAVSAFLQVADFWLVAAALAGKHTVVTHEVASPTLKRIKIPNVCIALGVDYVSPYAMLRKERARFVLGR